MYYTANEYGDWEPTSAKTLKAAKAVATKRNPYAGNPTVFVGIKVQDGDIERFERVAARRRGTWIDMDWTGRQP